jgi:hypothetical protein
MPFSISPIALRQWGLYGATGHSQWNVTAAPYSQRSGAGVSLMHQLIGMWWKMRNSPKSRLCIIWLKNWPFGHLNVLYLRELMLVHFVSCISFYFHHLCFPLADELRDPSCILLPPKSPSRPAPNLISGIAVALATRFGVSVGSVQSNEANNEEVGMRWIG